MRRLWISVQLGLPALTLGIVGGCIGPATNRQLTDTAASIMVRVFVQSVSSIIEAAILQQAA